MSAETLNDLEDLHFAILDAWNRQDAEAYGAFFDENALVIGYDGSEMHGSVDISGQLSSIFADHEVATYVRIVRRASRLGEEVGLLHAVVGMIPPGGDEVMPDRHAVQVLVGRRTGDRWVAQSLQNTPVQLHGRPEEVDALTDELQASLAR